MTEQDHLEANYRRHQYEQCFKDLRDIHMTNPSVLETILYMNVVNGDGQQDITELINTLAEIKRNRT